jgi:hypothetical protein
MLFLGSLLVLAMVGMVFLSLVVLRVVFPLVVFLVIGCIMLVPFMFILHPWFELLVVVLLIVIIVQRTRTDPRR